MTIKIGEFKGNNTISLYEAGKETSSAYPPFSFGLKKAKLILENLEEIKRFVEENK